jgi:hypothetical protein
MTIRDMQIEFERRLQTFDKTELGVNKLTSDTILAFINEATDKFVKTRYSGLNTKYQGFEQSQKRIDDLRTLVVAQEYLTVATGNVDTFDTNVHDLNVGDETLETRRARTYMVVVPDDYLLLLGDTAYIGSYPADSNDCWEKDANDKDVLKATDTLESTIETIDRQIADPLSEFHMKYCQARPLKLIRGNKIYLYTDDDYQIGGYRMTYLKQPHKWVNQDILDQKPCDLPDHTCIEIVKIAVELYMVTKPVGQYNSYTGEVQTME